MSLAQWWVRRAPRRMKVNRTAGFRQSLMEKTMTIDECEDAAHALAGKIADTMTHHVRKKLSRRGVTVAEVNSIVLSAVMLSLYDSLANIKCKECRAEAMGHVQRVMPEMMQDVGNEPTDEAHGLH
jgi:hypothetical protein